MITNMVSNNFYKIDIRGSPVLGKTLMRDGLLEEVGEVTPQALPEADSLNLLLSKRGYLEGQGDLVSGLIMGITRVTIWVIGVINLLTKSP